MKLSEFVRVPRVSNWAKICSSNLKGWRSDATANSRLLFVFVHLSWVHLTTLKIHSIFQTPLGTELWTKDIAGSSAQQWKWGYKSRENPIPICISWDTSIEQLLTGCYWAVWDCAVRKKSGQSGAKWVSQPVSGKEWKPKIGFYWF